MYKFYWLDQTKKILYNIVGLSAGGKVDKSRFKKALAILRQKKNAEVISLDDMIIKNMHRRVGYMVAEQVVNGHSFSGSVDFGDGIRLSISKSECYDWRDRFFEICNMAQSIAPRLKYDECGVLVRILDVDGWVLNRLTLKTPCWLGDYKEVEIYNLYDEFKEFEWLKNITEVI